MSSVFLAVRVFCLLAAGALALRAALRSSQQVRAALRVEAGRLTVHLHGWDVFWAQRRRLVIPLADVTSVCVQPAEPVNAFPLRGTWLPGGLRAGTFMVEGQLEFWDVRGSGLLLRVELRGGSRWSRLMLQLADPQAAARSLRAYAQPLVPAWL